MSDTPPDLTPEQVSPEPAPKKRIVRKARSAAEAPAKPQSVAEAPGTEQDSSPAPRKRAVRKKAAELADGGVESVDVPRKKTARKNSAEIPVEEAQDVPARPRRGRPRKKPVEEVPETDGSPVVSGTEAPVKPVRRRAVKAVAPENGASAGPEAEMAAHVAPAEPASDSVPEQPAEGRPKVIRQRFVRKPREQEPEADASAPSIKVVQEGAADFSEDAAREPRRTNEPQRQRFDRQNRRNNNDRFNKNRNNRQDGRNGRNGNDRVKNRWNNNHQEGGTPQNSAPRELAPPEPVDGLLEITNKGFGFLRKPDNDFDAFAEAVYVPQDMIRKFGLRPAVWVHGQACRHDRGILLTEIVSVNGVAPEKARKNPHFEELKAVNPNKRISFETRPERYTTRTLDLIAPIGRGQRGLIVSPPRAGKTTLLQHMAEAILENYRDSIHLMVLLVDERPEEVTEFKRSLPGAEVYASSNDGRVRDHCRMAELCIERAKRLVEAGQHVFLLMDSITRLARAYNNADKGSGRTMSGGIDARALEMPRRLFAAARNTRQAGSLTIIATALVETNSRMDDLIFQEFKGTGNMELVLNRRIAEQYIFPAVDILKSGTRREELIMPEAWLYKMNLIRRALAGHKPVEAMERFLFFLNKYPNNAQMLLDLKQKA
ncbi:transcription termination factor Rho [Akkermansia muciniphila]|uniref:transcription termination factor Rho n=1 Tax=Akkermansia muciniphila TaxID=239935 RepID=UPI00211B3E70|nr:transcription termination factor Rho [Akkermansia muciniphila]